MRSVLCIISVLFVGTAFTFGGGKKQSSSQVKTSQHDTNATGAQTNNSKSNTTKLKHQPTTISTASIRAMDANHDNRVTREEFMGSTFGKQNPELTNKIFDKSKGKDKSVTVQEIRDRLLESQREDAQHAKF